MADDEDVVFDNSPLYKHLSEVGFTHFDVESLNDTDQRVQTFPNKHLRQNNGENFAGRNLKEWAINLAKRFIWGYVLPSNVEEELSCYRSCVVMIKSSGLLVEDDLELLYRFEQCTNTAFETNSVVSVERMMGENNSNVTEENDSTLFSRITNRFMIGVTILVAIIFGFLSNTNSPNFKILSYISLSIVSLWLLLTLYFSWVKSRITKNIALLSNYIQFIDKLLVLIRKVILLIQEKELIARGHIIVNPAAPVMRLESKIKQCMMLRECLFVEMNNYFGILREKIKGVCNSRVLKNNYSNINWLQKELSRIQNECLPQSDTDLQANEYSIMTMKKSFATLGSHQSLLLCCITLNLILEIIYLKQSGAKRDNSYEFDSCLEDLLKGGKKCYDNVSQCYKFHKVDVPASIFDEKQENVSSVYSSFTMALRSMTLHLQQACKSSISIEEKLDRMISRSIKDPVCTNLDDINTQLLFIGQEIEKLTVCWEESQSRLKEIAFISTEKETSKNVVEGKANENSIEQEDRNVQTLNLAEKLDPVPDQIFEGETTSECDSESQYSSNLGREELLREEKIREGSRHLLQELKSVLATKDEGKMVGIPRVLLSKKFGAVDTKGDDGNTIESGGVAATDRGSGSVTESSQSEMEEKRSIDESLKSCVGEAGLAVKASEINVIKFPPKNPEESSLGSNDVETEVIEDIDDVHHSECSLNDESFIAETNHANPFASMVAAAAIARNRQFGMIEQSYEIEGETFSDDSDTNM